MKNTVAKFALAFLAGPLVLLAASAQDAKFIVAQHGSTVGSASYKFSSAGDGVSSSSVVHVSMQDLNYKLSKEEQLTPASRLEHVQLSATVNGTAVNITGGPDAGKFLLNIAANGKNSTSRLDLHPSAVFLPDFDPGAYQNLLSVAAANNNRDLWAIIPKEAGSVVPIKLATYADQQGTLDHKPIVVHHLVATISGNDTHIFSGPEDQVLQVELPYQGFALVRKGFVLTPAAKAGPPPAQPPAPAGVQSSQPPPNQSPY